MKLRESIENEIRGNKIYWALFVCGAVSMLTGFISEDGYLGWTQGFSIFIGIIILVAFSSYNDYTMDKRFINLQKWFKKQEIPVIRGKENVTQTVSIYDLVVGDVIKLQAGDIVPADSVIVRD